MIPPDLQIPGHRIRIGCDVVSLGEIEYSVSTFGARFLSKIYTAGELAACAGPNQLPRLAARFAAKEAAIKAFSAPDAHFVPSEIEVVASKPLATLRLTGSAAELAAAQNWHQISLSLTHAECHAAAVVVAVCGEGDTRSIRAE